MSIRWRYCILEQTGSQWDSAAPVTLWRPTRTRSETSDNERRCPNIPVLLATKKQLDRYLLKYLISEHRSPNKNYRMFLILGDTSFLQWVQLTAVYLILLPKRAASDSTKVTLVITFCNEMHQSHAICMFGRVKRLHGGLSWSNPANRSLVWRSRKNIRKVIKISNIC